VKSGAISIGATYSQEASMQRSPNDLKPSDRRFSWSWTGGILAVHGIILLVTISLILSYPAASVWISQAVEAEFVGNPPPVIVPTQIAQPRGQVRTVRTD
jgi:hypothetical protein